MRADLRIVSNATGRVIHDDDVTARASRHTTASLIIAVLETRRAYQMALAVAKRVLLAGPSLTMTWNDEAPVAVPSLMTVRPSRGIRVRRVPKRLRFVSAGAMKRRRAERGGARLAPEACDSNRM